MNRAPLKKLPPPPMPREARVALVRSRVSAFQHSPVLRGRTGQDPIDLPVVQSAGSQRPVVVGAAGGRSGHRLANGPSSYLLPRFSNMCLTRKS